MFPNSGHYNMEDPNVIHGTAMKFPELSCVTQEQAMQFDHSKDMSVHV
jgi:hypothetical protein